MLNTFEGQKQLLAGSLETLAIVAGEPFENLFACFGIPGGLPPELAARWLSAAPGIEGEARLLPPPEVLDLVEKIRAVPGVTEATARIVVR